MFLSLNTLTLDPLDCANIADAELLGAALTFRPKASTTVPGNPSIRQKSSVFDRPNCSVRRL
jgi:hypothetical protein